MMQSFVVDRGLLTEGRVPPVRIVPAFDPWEYGRAGLSLRAEGGPVQQLTLERGEKALAERIVVAIRDRAPGARLALR